MPNAVTSVSLVEMATKCLATAASSFARAEEPLARRARVGHRFLRRERLRRDDEQRGRADRSGRSVSARCAPSTFETKCSARTVVRVRRQRRGRHRRPEIRSADADVDDVGDAQAGVAEPRAAAHRLGERAHVIERGAARRASRRGRSTSIGRSDRLRSATCSTARLSVLLIGSPANIRSRSASTPVLRASSTSAVIESWVIRFFE